MHAKFWGVRGSVPSPLTPAQVQAKVRECLRRVAAGEPLTFDVESTHGGNTTCVEIVADNQGFVCDMGTGVRLLGEEQARKLFAEKAKDPRRRPVFETTILQSHLHWDHIQGFPFWTPLFLSRKQFDCRCEFFGGKSWDSKLDLVYRGQMSPPEFPVNLEELEQIAMKVQYNTIYDGWEREFGAGIPLENDEGWEANPVKVLARKLFHPQDTFGYRIQDARGRVITFTTDHEPYAAGIPQGLAELVKGADIWITDCQYSHAEYCGSKGPQKMGWGHSYPEYIAAVAKETQPKRIITTHHDPNSDDLRILEIAAKVQELSNRPTMAAYEGLMVEVP